MSSSTDNATTQGSEPDRKVTMNFNKETQQVETFIHSPGKPTPYKVPGTNEEWGDFLDRHMPIQKPKPTPPDQLSQDTLDLYKKAVNEPGSLTEEETLTILDWVPEAVADERCREVCGSTWQELITTAVETPQELTSDQVSCIKHGRHTTYKTIDADHKRIFGKLNLPVEKRTLWLAAQEAAKGPQYAIAERNARKAGYRIDDERNEAFSHLSDDDIENIRNSTYIPWIAQLTASSKPHWGLVCFRTAYDDEEAWTKYKAHILRSSHVGLWSYPGTDSADRKWKIDFVEDERERLDGASLEDLCKYFKDPPSSSSSISSALSSGLRSDCFLFADARAISSLNDPPSDPWPQGLIPAPGAPPPATEHLIPGYVGVCDASYEPSETYPHDFKGILKVHPAHISTTFYHRLWRRGQEKGTEDWWYYKQSIETMYKVANGRSSREGGVYPPHSRHNY